MSDVEGYKEPGAAEGDQGGSEKADEALGEQIRKARKAAKGAKKDEGKARAKDNRLAKVITGFLQSRQGTPMAVLLARLLERNTPADFLISLLSLGAHQEDDAKTLQLKPGQDSTKAIAKTPSGDFDFEHLSPELKTEINRWVSAIDQSAKIAPLKILLALRDPSGEPTLSSVQVTAFLLRDFLSQHDLNFDFKKIQEFARFTLSGILIKLAAENKIPSLGTGDDDDEDEDDDDDTEY